PRTNDQPRAMAGDLRPPVAGEGCEHAHVASGVVIPTAYIKVWHGYLVAAIVQAPRIDVRLAEPCTHELDLFLENFGRQVTPRQKEQPTLPIPGGPALRAFLPRSESRPA